MKIGIVFGFLLLIQLSVILPVYGQPDLLKNDFLFNDYLPIEIDMGYDPQTGKPVYDKILNLTLTNNEHYPYSENLIINVTEHITPDHYYLDTVLLTVNPTFNNIPGVASYNLTMSNANHTVTEQLNITGYKNSILNKLESFKHDDHLEFAIETRNGTNSYGILKIYDYYGTFDIHQFYVRPHLSGNEGTIYFTEKIYDKINLTPEYGIAEFWYDGEKLSHTPFHNCIKDCKISNNELFATLKLYEFFNK